MKTLDKSTQTKWDAPKVKYFGVPLEKAAKADDGTVTVRGFFTSDNKDVTGDIITRGATERAVPAYKRWGNIRYMHLPKPVAKVIRIGENDGLAWNEVEIKVIDPQAKFEVENGLLAALSVGILLNFEDIDFMEDGGMLINDYLLAEISLVDHPANYDAALTGMKDVFQNLAALNKETALKTLEEMKAAITQGDTNMTTEIEETVPVVPVEENKEVEPVAEEQPVTEELAPETEQPVEKAAEETPEEETQEEEVSDPILKGIGELADAFYAMATEINQSITALSASIEAALAKAPEASAEVLGTEEQADSEEKTAESPVTEDETTEEPGLPVNRTAAVLPTDLPEIDEAPAKEEKKDLRSSLRKYFESKNSEVKNG